MLRTAFVFALLLAAAPAWAIPGVTIPFPDEVETRDEEETASDLDDAVSDIVLGDPAATQPDTAIEAVDPTQAGPWLASGDYPRPEMMEGSVIRLVWQVQIEDMDGEAQGAPITRTILVGPDFAYDSGETPPVLYDFTHARRLTADPQAGTYQNTSLYGDVRRRLDTYLALSRGGTLDDIPFGPDRSFDRFWLESAMGLRRAPAELTTTRTDGRTAVLRAGGLQIFSFDARMTEDSAEDIETAVEDAAEDDAPADDADGGFEGVPTDDITALLRGDTGGAPFAADDEVEATPAPAPVDEGMHYGLADPIFRAAFRGWMRQALPIHPDAFVALDGSETIPERFSFVVVSPNSPEGRREIWTLAEVQDPEAVFPLPGGLTPAFGGAIEPVAASAQAALEALQNNNPPASADIAERAAELRGAGDMALAYLTLYQDSAHRGQCQMGGTDRPACAALGPLVAAGLGNAEFEALLSGLAGLSTGDAEAAYGAVLPYLDATGFAGAAANLIAGNELIAWAASADADAQLPDRDPFALLTASAQRDPYAPAIYWHLAQAHLAANRADAAWTLLDMGRALPGGADHELLRQAGILEARLKSVAPDFFGPH
ncbi:MAG: hypothetical protein CMF74_09575 [Maricaulis sp.]|jgi:hypothetical protein|nr:hypothetical protein [Maricaulis sp.]HAQ35829.1 hypothetical protein [Alphaproteobacteria bacterium]